MHVDVTKLDEYVRFLRNESQRLRERGDGAWADKKATTFDEIAETLRQLRQDKQMTGIGGKRLSDNG